MTSLTATQMLPYPSGTDRPCDAASQWCAFSAALDAKLHAYDQSLARLNPTFPMAVVSRTTIWNANQSGFPVKFDTVIVDTDNMVDLSTDSTIISLPRPGYYAAGMFTNIPSTVVPDATIGAAIAVPQLFSSNGSQHVTRDFGVANTVMHANPSFVVSSNITSNIQIVFGEASAVGAFNNMTLNNGNVVAAVTAYAYWLRDPS